MPVRDHLEWNVPRSPWERHERRVLDRIGFTDLYAGIEAERIARLWLELEDTGATPRAGHTGTPLHTQKKKESDTPLADQEKTKVQARFLPDIKERLKIAASEYEENPGVLLGYILREYYETGGWGYSIEAVDSPTSTIQEDEEPVPYHVENKKDYICERVEPDPNGTIHADDLRGLIAEVAGGSRVDDYLPDILDRLDYVHHPHIYGLYIPLDDLADYGLTIDDPAIDRKPYEALTRSEKIEGIKERLRSNGASMTVGRIHAGIFDGKGSTSHMRDLVSEISESDGFAYRSTPGGTKVLRYAPGKGNTTAPGSAVGDGGTDT